MVKRSAITTHILDTAGGCPASGVPVVLEMANETGFQEVGRGVTDDDGRLGSLTTPNPIATGVYRITFQIAEYFERRNQESFYPEAQISFHVRDGAQHYHVPLLLAPFGYSTYRGS